MKLATWNVNSLKVRLPHVLEFLTEHKPDALCLQETKSEDANFPAVEMAAAGYQVVFAGQKTYNGVAILSRALAQDVTLGIPTTTIRRNACWLRPWMESGSFVFMSPTANLSSRKSTSTNSTG